MATENANIRAVDLGFHPMSQGASLSATVAAVLVTGVIIGALLGIEHYLIHPAAVSVSHAIASLH